MTDTETTAALDLATATRATSSKAAVLDAAQRLLQQHGYVGFSMRELAQQSGVAKATIYHHFPDKRAIFLSVLDRHFRMVTEQLLAAAARPGATRARLAAVIRAYFAVSTEHGSVLLSSLREAADVDAEICDVIRHHRPQLLQPILTVLEEGMARGELRPAHPEMAVMSLLGMLHIFAGHHLLLGNLQLDDTVVDHVLDLFLYGLVAQDGPPDAPAA
jgi:AcrR family transcriptional regulator